MKINYQYQSKFKVTFQFEKINQNSLIYTYISRFPTHSTFHKRPKTIDTLRLVNNGPILRPIQLLTAIMTTAHHPLHSSRIPSKPPNPVGRSGEGRGWRGVNYLFRPTAAFVRERHQSGQRLARLKDVR